MSELGPGDIFADRFEVIGTLGRGGTASVYLAEDRVRGEQVAIKVLHAHLTHDPAMRRRLRREVQAASLVRNDSALVAHDLHEVDGVLALSMPMHHGTTLTERVRASGALTVDELRVLAERISAALSSAHRVGVLHRDVTPNNVMLGDSPDDAQLTDFGFARTVEGTATRTAIIGTPGYAAPETYSGHRGDPRADLYGLGAVLFFAATGQNPFGEGPPAGILTRQLADERQPLSSLRPDLPTDLVQTIEALLASDPDRRPPSAREVAVAVSQHQPALVPSVPDSWSTDKNPLLPASSPARRLDLPQGDVVLVLQKKRRGNPQVLADNVARVAGLEPGSVPVSAAMTRKGRFQLTHGTGRAMARRLEQAAKAAGYKVERFRDGPPTWPERFADALPVLIPILWVAFPFVTVELLGGGLALFLTITATILIGSASSQFSAKQLDEDLPLGVPEDLALETVGLDERARLESAIRDYQLPSFFDEIAREFVADDDMREMILKLQGFFGSKPAKAPDPQSQPPPPDAVPTSTPPQAAKSRAESLRSRAVGNLDLLHEAVVAKDDLPDLAAADLQATVVEMREQAGTLARTAVALEATLASLDEPDETSWIHRRLTRLETLARAGQPVDAEEQVRLQAALESAEAAASSRDRVESRLTATLAQLLEIAATATRVRSELLADPIVSAPDLTRRLRLEVAAVDAVNEELDLRRRAATEAAKP